jgi:hypothetical protein
MNLQQELRDLAIKLAGVHQKPPFDFEGFRALIDERCKGQTEEEMQREIEGIRRMIPNRTWKGHRT